MALLFKPLDGAQNFPSYLAVTYAVRVVGWVKSDTVCALNDDTLDSDWRIVAILGCVCTDFYCCGLHLISPWEHDLPARRNRLYRVNNSLAHRRRWGHSPASKRKVVCTLAGSSFRRKYKACTRKCLVCFYMRRAFECHTMRGAGSAGASVESR